MMKKAVVTFGRFQPPCSIGYQKLFDYMAKMATHYDAEILRIFISPRREQKFEPLGVWQKLSYLQDIYPEYAPEFTLIFDAFTPIHMMKCLAKQGFTTIYFVTGSVYNYSDFYDISKYIKSVNDPTYDPDVHYDLDIKVTNIIRKPEEYSGTELRKCVLNDDFKTFCAKSIFRNNINLSLARNLFNEMKKTMKIDYSELVRKQIDLSRS